jgi:hypothetical protein
MCPATRRLSPRSRLTTRRARADGPFVAIVDWDNLDLEPLTHELREGVGGPDGEKMIWAFEQALGIARIDPDLLNYILAAAACLLAHEADDSPRAVLDAFSRRSISDCEWHERYAGLIR